MKKFSMHIITLTIIFVILSSISIYADEDGKSSNNFIVTISSDEEITLYDYYLYYLEKESDILVKNNYTSDSIIHPENEVTYNTTSFSSSTISFGVSKTFENSVLEKDLDEEPKIQSDSYLIKNIVNSELPFDRFEDMNRYFVLHLLNYVQENVTYNESSHFRNKGAITALLSGEGVCEDFSDLLVALCRAANIPARKIVGIILNKETNKAGFHAWTSIYYDGNWHEIDPLVPNGELFSNWEYFNLGENGTILGKTFSNGPTGKSMYDTSHWSIVEIN